MLICLARLISSLYFAECEVPKYCQSKKGIGAYHCSENDENEHCVPPDSCCEKCQHDAGSAKAYHLQEPEHHCLRKFCVFVIGPQKGKWMFCVYIFFMERN